jgi:hypothetical protein
MHSTLSKVPLTPSAKCWLFSFFSKRLLCFPIMSPSLIFYCMLPFLNFMFHVLAFRSLLPALFIPISFTVIQLTLFIIEFPVACLLCCVLVCSVVDPELFRLGGSGTIFRIRPFLHKNLCEFYFKMVFLSLSTYTYFFDISCNTVKVLLQFFDVHLVKFPSFSEGGSGTGMTCKAGSGSALNHYRTDPPHCWFVCS